MLIYWARDANYSSFANIDAADGLFDPMYRKPKAFFNVRFTPSFAET